MTTIQERFGELKHYYNISGRGLASVLGMKPATITNYLSGAKSPSYEFINSLLATYPDVSAEWLLRGEGAMLKSEPIDMSTMRHKYEMEILVKDGIIKELRSIILEKESNNQTPERKQLVG